jgi:hypothetical protein
MERNKEDMHKEQENKGGKRIPERESNKRMEKNRTI